MRIYTKTSQIHKTFHVDYVPTGTRSLYVWRTTVTDHSDGDVFVTEGISKGLPSARDPQPAYPGSDYKNGGEWVLLHKEGVDTLRTKGYTHSTPGEYHYEWQKAVAPTPFSTYTSNNKDEYTILRIFDYAHIVFNQDGTLFPVCKRFDYISGRVTNRCYDLAEAEALLRARGDIHEVTVVDVPTYNRDDGYTRALEFSWIPSSEDYTYVYNGDGRGGVGGGIRMWEREQRFLNLVGLSAIRKDYKDIVADDDDYDDDYEEEY